MHELVVSIAKKQAICRIIPDQYNVAHVLLVTYCQLQRISHGHMCFYISLYRFCYTYHAVFMSVIIVLPRIKKDAEVENKYQLKKKLVELEKSHFRTVSKIVVIIFFGQTPHCR